jgi:hypothetical protein
MTSLPLPDTAPDTGECKRPGCTNTVPPGAGRGRHRVFCSDDCARRYHNDARILLPTATSGDPDPLAALEQTLRQAAVLTRAARDQATALDPTRVRADIAEAEAARRRAEAAAVTAQAHQAEAQAETQTLTEALHAARADQAAAADTARQAEGTARAHAAELEQLRRATAQQVAAAQAEATGYQHERDDALTAARNARTATDTETTRARQAEADARDETQRVRDDAARERDTLRENHNAQLQAHRALIDAERSRAERAEAQLETERADRRQLTTHITANSNHEQPSTPTRSGARSK